MWTIRLGPWLPEKPYDYEHCVETGAFFVVGTISPWVGREEDTIVLLGPRESKEHLRLIPRRNADFDNDGLHSLERFEPDSQREVLFFIFPVGLKISAWIKAMTVRFLLFSIVTVFKMQHQRNMVAPCYTWRDLNTLRPIGSLYTIDLVLRYKICVYTPNTVYHKSF